MTSCKIFIVRYSPDIMPMLSALKTSIDYKLRHQGTRVTRLGFQDQTSITAKPYVLFFSDLTFSEFPETLPIAVIPSKLSFCGLVNTVSLPTFSSMASESSLQSGIVVFHEFLWPSKYRQFRSIPPIISHTRQSRHKTVQIASSDVIVSVFGEHKGKQAIMMAVGARNIRRYHFSSLSA
jgi:hypothetical protein